MTVEIKIKLMAEFMDDKIFINYPPKFWNKEHWDESGFNGSLSDMFWDVDEMKYHTSFEWLIPVWYKFKNLHFNDVKHEFEHAEWKRNIDLILLCSETEKDALNDGFEKLVEAIKWYNQTQIHND